MNRFPHVHKKARFMMAKAANAGFFHKGRPAVNIRSNSPEKLQKKGRIHCGRHNDMML